MSTATPDRLRPHPTQRFAPPTDLFDLRWAADQLEKEQGSGQHGHKQITLFKHGPATVALYAFDAGSRLDHHVVDGPVILHALTGKLRVQAERQIHRLEEGMMLRLAPGVPHDVTAQTDGRMLMITCVEGPLSHT
ncbi:MAG: AraC family ligand binding domain-containing protein [Phycisphaeraceae bacterium]